MQPIKQLINWQPSTQEVINFLQPIVWLIAVTYVLGFTLGEFVHKLNGEASLWPHVEQPHPAVTAQLVGLNSRSATLSKLTVKELRLMGGKGRRKADIINSLI